jgi:hypothetical protein
MNARDWLRDNGYEDVADLIDEVMAECKMRGSGERRDWWDILAGNANGQACVVAGREFPVLWRAQRRQGRKPTPNALKRNLREKPPPIRQTGRWPERKV